MCAFAWRARVARLVVMRIDWPSRWASRWRRLFQVSLHASIYRSVIPFAPPRVLIVSATDDPFTYKADHVVAVAQDKYVDLDSTARITHNRYEGESAVTHECFDDIVRWLVQGAGCVGSAK